MTSTSARWKFPMSRSIRSRLKSDEAETGAVEVSCLFNSKKRRPLTKEEEFNLLTVMSENGELALKGFDLFHYTTPLF